MDTEWECMECGYLHEGKTPPHACPDCGTTGVWERVELVDDRGAEELDEDDTDELGKPNEG
jgi:rubredoxin